MGILSLPRRLRRRADGVAPPTPAAGSTSTADYDMRPAPSFPFDTTKQRRSMYVLERYGLPELYGHGVLKRRV